MVVKLQGEFVWHSHPDTDDFFFVVKGDLTIKLRDGDVRLGPGDLYVVPKGVEHCPVAEQEVRLLLIEPTGTPNTGDIATAAVKRQSDRVRQVRTGMAQFSRRASFIGFESFPGLGAVLRRYEPERPLLIFDELTQLLVRHPRPQIDLREVREVLGEKGAVASLSGLSRFFRRHGITRKKGISTPTSKAART